MLFNRGMTVTPLQITITPSDTSAGASNFFSGNDGPSFKDVLDIINPLQQLPIVSTIYRSLTDDTISTGSRLAGGALFGGPVGFIAALVNSIMEGETGQDVGGTVLSALQGGDDSVEVAQNSPPSMFGNVDVRRANVYAAYVQAQTGVA